MAEESEGGKKAPLAVTTVVKDGGLWEKSVSVSVAAEEVNKEHNTVVGSFSGAVNLPGFRPGKVPRDVIEKRFGADIRKQLTANLVERAFAAALEKENLKAIGEPEVTEAEKLIATKGQPFSFEFKTEVMPQFELPPYTGLKGEQEEIDVLPEEIEHALTALRERFAEEVPAEEGHAIVEKDNAAGVLRVLVDGNEVLKEEDAHLLCVQGHVFGAYAHLGSKFLLGAKVGEKRAVDEALAGNFPVEEHRAKKATIEFEVKSIKTVRLPAVDDELAKNLGFPDLAALNDKIRSSLLEKIGDTIKTRVREDILKQIIDKVNFELPPKMLARAASENMVQSIQYLAQMGVQPGAVGLTPEKMADNSQSAGVAELKRYFTLSAIADKENITAEEEEVDEYIVGLARRQNVKAQDLFDRLAAEGKIPQIEADIRLRKAIDFVLDAAEIAVVPRKPFPKDPAHEHDEHAPGHEHSHDHGDEHGEPAEHGHEHGGHEHGEHAEHGHEHGGHDHGEHAEHGHDGHVHGEHAEHGHEHGEHGHEEHGHEHGA